MELDLSNQPSSSHPLQEPQTIIRENFPGERGGGNNMENVNTGGQEQICTDY